MRRQKLLLFHAIQPGRHRPQEDWANFLHEAALQKLPEGAEQLAPNVWVLPDDDSWLLLSRLGEKNATETRIRPFSPASDWQPLSPRS